MSGTDPGDTGSQWAAGVAADLADLLRTWRPPGHDQAQLRQDYLDLILREGPRSVDRTSSSHVTASCLILSPDLAHVVLSFHRKGRFWVQPGGHLERQDVSCAAAALREVEEEIGLTGVDLVPGMVGLDRHELSPAFGSCRVHWDVSFVGIAERQARVRASTESEDVAWFPRDGLPPLLASGVRAGVERVAASYETGTQETRPR